jgi:hypothetical protein
MRAVTLIAELDEEGSLNVYLHRSLDDFPVESIFRISNAQQIS